MHFGPVQATGHPCRSGCEAARTAANPGARVLPASTRPKKSGGALRRAEESDRTAPCSPEKAKARSGTVPNGRNRAKPEALGSATCQSKFDAAGILQSPDTKPRNATGNRRGHPGFLSIPLPSNEFFNSYKIDGHLRPTLKPRRLSRRP